MNGKPQIGLGYRRELAPWLQTRPAAVDCLEITAEHFFDGGETTLRQLRDRYPLYLHGLGLSLGTPEPLDEATLDRFANVARVARPVCVSEHIAFTRAGGVDLGHLNPVPRTRGSLATLAEHARRVSGRCDCPILLENIATPLDLGGEMDETGFLNELCERANCRLLLDVTNLFINSRNHGFDASGWLRRIDPARIVQLHVVGYAVRDGRHHDTHGARMQDDLLELVREVIEYAPVQSVILERDDRLDELEEIGDELVRLRSLVAS